MRRKGTKLIAIYGATAEVHDHITRNPGSFDALKQGISYLKEARTAFTVQIIPMKDNYFQYQDMISLAESLSPYCRIGAAWLYLSAYGNAQKTGRSSTSGWNPPVLLKSIVRISPIRAGGIKSRLTKTTLKWTTTDSLQPVFPAAEVFTSIPTVR